MKSKKNHKLQTKTKSRTKRKSRIRKLLKGGKPIEFNPDLAIDGFFQIFLNNHIINIYDDCPPMIKQNNNINIISIQNTAYLSDIINSIKVIK
jgi:hypothetical protein